MTHVRLGNAPHKSAPYYKDKKGRLGFNPRPGIKIDYGISFDKQRGHRVYFCYIDTPHIKNTWGVKSLRAWLRKLNAKDRELKIIRTICFQQCALAEEMQAAWIDAGKPDRGVSEPKGPTQ